MIKNSNNSRLHLSFIKKQRLSYISTLSIGKLNPLKYDIGCTPNASSKFQQLKIPLIISILPSINHQNELKLVSLLFAFWS